MQYARVKGVIIIIGFSPLVKSYSVRLTLCSCVKIILWLVKKFRSVVSDIDILGAANFTEYGSPAEKEAFDFMYQFVNGKDFPSVFFVLKFWPNIFSMQEIWVCTQQNVNVLFVTLQLFENSIRNSQTLKHNASFTIAFVTSFDASYFTVRNKAHHTIGEPLLLPAYMELHRTMHFSNKRIMRHIESLSEDFKEQLQPRFKCSPKYPVQVDELTDVAGFPELLVFVRFLGRVLSERWTGTDILKVVSQKKVFVGQTAPAFVQAEQELWREEEVRQIASHVNLVHCVINGT